MDPEMTALKLRVMADQVLKSYDNETLSGPTAVVTVLEMAELFVGLDDWLRKSGFVPRHWRQHDSPR